MSTLSPPGHGWRPRAALGMRPGPCSFGNFASNLQGLRPLRPQDATSLGNSDCSVVTRSAPHLALAYRCSRKQDSPPPPPLPTPSCSLLHPSNNQEAVTSQKLAFLPTDVLRVKTQSTYQSAGAGRARFGSGLQWRLPPARQLLLSRDQLPLLPWGCSVSVAPGQGGWRGKED